MSSDAPPRVETGDAEALDAAAATIAVPHVEPADSFVLHAPLELLARAGLLTMVSPAGRGAVLDRMHDVAAGYRAWGTPLERRPNHSPAIEADAAAVLQDATATGDSDAADDAITWLTSHLDTDDLVRALAGPVLPSLAAAAHGSILLYLLPRVAARSLPAASMARSTVHELVRHPEWTLTWFDDESVAGPPDTEAELTRRLVAPRAREKAANTFIYPTMSTAERTGLAHDSLADLIGGLTIAAARRSLLRTAALSMLQDDPGQAPYGWSHCLTMPQAALGIAHAAPDPQVAIAVAATYVLGFRSTLGSTPLDHRWSPQPVTVDVDELVSAPPGVAAAAAWNTSIGERSIIWRTLAAHAGAHADAHLAKYTLACVDAARSDPRAHDLYLGAAAYLNAWWNEQARSN